MKTCHYIGSVALAGLLITVSAAQEPHRAAGADQSKTATGKLAHHDQEFVKKAAIGGMAEVQLAQLAEQKATSDSCKDFAKQLKKDHQEANGKLETLAKSNGAMVPDALDPAHQKKVQQLSSKAGAEFDKAWINTMVKDHQETIALFEREEKSGSDSMLKEFAKDSLPTLREHLKTAQSLQSQTKSRSASDSQR